MLYILKIVCPKLSECCEFCVKSLHVRPTSQVAVWFGKDEQAICIQQMAKIHKANSFYNYIYFRKSYE